MFSKKDIKIKKRKGVGDLYVVFWRVKEL